MRSVVADLAASLRLVASRYAHLIYLEPFEEGYRRLFRPRPDECIAPFLLPETVVDLKELYGHQ